VVDHTHPHVYETQDTRYDPIEHHYIDGPEDQYY